MARQKALTGEHNIAIDFGTISDRQKEFMEADTFYVCYGGA